MGPHDPSLLDAQQRLQALAQLFARAILRLYGRGTFRAPTPPGIPLAASENSPNSTVNVLEVGADPRLTVHTS
jgi:hypothetical protein